ncbi:MAG: hypothetical protein JWN18_470 [Parcubacteria group bacterium]|nr:hypothetical protein [Parcubacteria group bacterium]
MNERLKIKRDFSDFSLGDPILKALNPEGKQFMRIRWLRDSHPFTSSWGIKVAALIPFGDFVHLKMIPTFMMMQEDLEEGRYDGITTLVVPSSGNTAHAAVRLAPCFDFRHTKIIMANDVPDAKVAVLKVMPNVTVIQCANVTATAIEEAKSPQHYLFDQYSHMGNVRAHELYTGEEVWRLIGKDLSAIAVAMGSGGTIAGIGRALRKNESEAVVIGVRPKLGEQVPGARDAKKMEEISRLPWKTEVEHLAEISRRQAFEHMVSLWSEVEPQPGPTSGLAWAGLEQYLDGLQSRELDALSGKVVAFICPDDYRLYTSAIMAELDPK